MGDTPTADEARAATLEREKLSALAFLGVIPVRASTASPSPVSTEPIEAQGMAETRRPYQLDKDPVPEAGHEEAVAVAAAADEWGGNDPAETNEPIARRLESRQLAAKLKRRVPQAEAADGDEPREEPEKKRGRPKKVSEMKEIAHQHMETMKESSIHAAEPEAGPAAHNARNAAGLPHNAEAAVGRMIEATDGLMRLEWNNPVTTIGRRKTIDDSIKQFFDAGQGNLVIMDMSEHHENITEAERLDLLSDWEATRSVGKIRSHKDLKDPDESKRQPETGVVRPMGPRP
eukprot:jgi/Tetstr1/453175/TSEL_040192.t1